MRKSYPSDISREQFERLRPLLESARRRTRPRTVEPHEVFCAVLYLLRSGCQWRMLPESFPQWRTVHAYFTIWSEPADEGSGLLEGSLKKSAWHGAQETGTAGGVISFEGLPEKERTVTGRDWKKQMWQIFLQDALHPRCAERVDQAQDRPWKLKSVKFCDLKIVK